MLQSRGLLRVAVALGMSFVLVIGSVFADEILGVITKVDPEAGKITVLQKKVGKEHKEHVLDVDPDAILVTPKDEVGSRVDLKKLEDRLAKAKEKKAESKGIFAKITHEDGKVSKIEIAKKKAGPNP